MALENKKNPPPDKSIHNEREPEQEPNIYLSTGQHQLDIVDERSKDKHGNRPHRRNDINLEADEEPVEEKSPGVSDNTAP